MDVIQDSGLSENTIISYQKGWNKYAAWCEARGLSLYETSPQQAADFFGAMHASGSGLSLGTLAAYRSAITWVFHRHGLSPPTRGAEVEQVFRRLARRHGRRKRQAKPLLAEHVELINAICPPSLIGLRDSMLISLGFAAALRRSELVALCLSDIVMPDGPASARALVKIRRSKTDQAGMGYEIPIVDGERIRPLSRIRHWIEAAGLAGGETPLLQGLTRGGHLSGRPLFHDAISRIVKQYAGLIGLDAADYSAHSLRAGFVTSAAMAGARMDKIMDVTRHTGTAMVMQYIRDASKFDDHAGASFL